jgi:hypothetical protein
MGLFVYCRCQACTHCHVESSPARTEMMNEAIAQRCLQLLAASNDVTCLDITGGAPELISHFRYCCRGEPTLSCAAVGSPQPVLMIVTSGSHH